MTTNEGTGKSNKELPKKLYKYYAFNDFSIKALKNKEAWFSSRLLFNDPFDCRVNLHAETNKGKFIERVDGILEMMKNLQYSPDDAVKSMKQFQGSLHQTADELADKTGIFCMSEDPGSILMWSHYADSHSGFCVEIELDDDVRRQENAALVDVEYGEYPKETLMDLFYMLYDPGEGDFEAMKLMLARKDRGWSYEREWRVFTWLEEGAKGCGHPFPGTITKIAFGLAMKDGDQRKIMSIVGSEMEYVKAHCAQRAFEIGFERIAWTA